MRGTRYAPTGLHPENLYIVFGAGQSLALGISPTSPNVSITRAQQYYNVMPNGPLGPIRPLIEPVYMTVDVSSGIETVHSALARMLTYLLDTNESIDPATYRQLHFSTGRSGTAMAGINQGTDAYQDSLDLIAAAQAWAIVSADVLCMLLIHGEQDDVNGTANYAALVADLHSDYQTDLLAITGQAGAIPMFLCQMHSWTEAGNATSLIPIAQLAANTGDVHLVCPKYHLAYIDGRHLERISYTQLGEHYAVAIYDELWGAGWDPLMPTAVSRTTNVITLTFHVPSGGTLVLDTTTVTNPGNYGFEYTDATSSATIASVALLGTTQVQVTLSGTPTGGSKRIRYAYTGTAGALAGSASGARGCLRDDDARYLSRNGFSLHNWCVTFDMAVT